MSLKLQLCVLLLVVGTTILASPAPAPVDWLDLMEDDGERFLYKLADYLNDYEDDEPTKGSARDEPSEKKEMCTLPMRRGLCRALITRWRYDPTTKTCSIFMFGGCDGNQNNFENYNKCMETCKGI